MTSLKKLVRARWFPTVTKPIVSGLVASGAVLGLRAFGVTDVVPAEINSLASPLVGFLIAAIVQKAGGSTPLGTVQVKATVATHTATYAPMDTLGKTIAQTLLDPIAKEIDSDPALVNELAAKALERVLNPALLGDVVKPAQEVVATGNEAPHTN